MKEGTVISPVFRIAWPNVFEPAKNKDGSDGLYSITMLFPKKADIDEMNILAWNKAKARWAERFEGLKEGVWPKKVTCIRDGEDKAEEGYEYYSGMNWAKATTKFKFPVVDRDGLPVTESAKVYPGVYARAFVDCYTYDNDGNKGVNFGLQALQILKDGERFGGGGPVDATALDWGSVDIDENEDDW